MQQSFKVKPTQKQKVLFTQNLQRSMELLSQSTQDLSIHINNTLVENPFLEERDSGALGSAYKKGELLDYNLSNIETLSEKLQKQIVDLNPPANLEPVLFDIVSAVNANGFCKDSHHNIISMYPKVKNNTKDIVFYLKQLEPTGIAAEELWQSLVWQAELFYPKNYLLVDLIEILRLQRTSMVKFTHKDIESLASLLHIEESLVESEIELLKSLDPFPVRDYSENHQSVIPEIKVSVTDGNLETKVRNELLPDLDLNDDLYDQFQSSGGGKEWENKFKDAVDLIGAIKYRGESLQNLATELVKYQKDFFVKGASFVKPMQLGMMAERLQVHRSTISRIVSRKYLECDHGVFPLKFFFQNVIKANDGQIRGIEALQQTILALIATEHCSQPYSDQVLSNILQKRGFDIQRRTVTKYRKMLHIPAAAFRKGVELL
jgi:RNA polymerase sigma-54 factor